jgi:hypothetical protein
MTRCLQAYESEYARIEEHRHEIGQRAKALTSVQSSLIRGSGSVLEGPEEA